jgi:hypothetical protein
MTEYRYPVNPIRFPNGLNLCVLVDALHELWPADLRATSFTILGPRPPGGYRAGVLVLETPRDMTLAEQRDTEDVMRVHPGGDDKMVGAALGSLPPVVEATGSVLFVRDLPRAAPATGRGTLVYSDGVAWRRVSNDEVI